MPPPELAKVRARPAGRAETSGGAARFRDALAGARLGAPSPGSSRDESTGPGDAGGLLGSLGQVHDVPARAPSGHLPASAGARPPALPTPAVVRLLMGGTPACPEARLRLGGGAEIVARLGAGGVELLLLTGRATSPKTLRSVMHGVIDRLQRRGLVVRFRTDEVVGPWHR